MITIYYNLWKLALCGLAECVPMKEREEGKHKEDANKTGEEQRSKKKKAKGREVDKRGAWST